VARSNQASQSNAVPAIAAAIGTNRERRTIARNSKRSEVASNRSSPAQAMSQCSVKCFEGSVALK
jgi:hypothetical protein